MTTKLNQIIAVEKGVKTDATRRITDLHRQVQVEDLLSGISRTYKPRAEDGDELPGESKKVQVIAADKLREAADIWTRLWDVTLTKDTANCAAAADIRIGDQVLARKVPVTYLLFLEKQLTDLHTFIAKLPLLNPADDWDADETTGWWKTPPSKTWRGQRILRNHVLYEATDKHPAQVQTFPEDVPVGDWTVIKFSGAMKATRVRQLLDRVEELQRAVKFAREEANSTEVTDAKIGESVFSWLLAG